MPTLGQSNTSIYGDIHLPKPLNIGGQPQSVGRAAAGPTAAMTKLAIDQQKEQQIQQLAQQYGDDYDGLVKAITAIDPDRGFAAQKSLADARTSEAQQRLKQTDSSLKDLTWVEDGVKLAIQDPTQYPKLLQDLSKAPGGSRFLQYAPDPNDPDLQQKLQNILPVFVDTKDFQKVSQQSYRDYLDGDLELSAVRKLAAADTPQKRQMVESELKGAGLKDYIGQYPDAASAAQARDALIAQRQKEKPDAGDKPKDLIPNATGGLTGTVGASMARYMRDHNLTDVRDVPQAVQDKFQKLNAESNKVVVTTGGAAGSGGLTTGEGGGLEYEGTIARIMGRTPVGFTRSGVAVPIANEAARQTKMLGRTPLDSMLSTAIYQGDSKALANIQKMEAAAGAYEDKAQKQLDIVDGLSDKVTRTKFPILNAAILAGKTEILGDPDATLLLNAIQTASTEYAKIVMGGTASAQALSDTAAKESKKLLNSAMSAGTLKKATALMRTEMGLTMNGFGASRKYIMDKMKEAGGGPAASPQAAPQAAPAVNPKDPMGLR